MFARLWLPISCVCAVLSTNGCPILTWLIGVPTDTDTGRGAGIAVVAALRAMAPGDEVLISYIDQRLNVDERRQVLESHYGFSCGCARCKADLRKKLRGGARALRAEGTGRALR